MKFINLNNLHIYFFYLFLFSIPFQTRKVFLTEYSFYSGDFTEWTTFFVYASDVFLILALFFWIVFVLKNYSFKKRCKNNFVEGNMKVKDNVRKYCPHFSEIIKFLYDKFKKTTELSKVWLFLFAFLFWIALNLAISNNYVEISVFQTVKLIELSLLAFFVYFNLKNKKILINSLLILVFAGFLQSLVAIYQFIVQHSIFTSPVLAKITGEAVLGPQVPGVAKILVDGEKIVRAYGTFPHPNILGSFLIFTTLITIYIYSEHKRVEKSSEFEQDINSESEQKLIFPRSSQMFTLVYVQISKFLKLFSYDNTKTRKSQGVLYPLLWIILLFSQATAIFFTFSRTAWAGFLLSLSIICIFYFYNHKIVSRETISKINNSIKNTIIKFKELFIVFLLLIFLVISNFSIIQARIGDNLLSVNSRLPDNSAISDRNFYNNVSRETISNNSFFGSGLGTYIFQIDGYLEKNKIKQKFEPWQYQPAHNIYFLIASETGVIGLLFFLLFLVYIISISIKIVSRETIFKNYSSPDKGRLGGVFEKLQNCNSELMTRNFFSFLLNIFTLRRCRFKVDEYRAHKPSLALPIRPSLRTGSCQGGNPNSSSGKGNYKNSPLERSGGVFENSQDYNLKSNNNVSRETLLDIRKLNFFLLAILISFLFIGLFDHYFWTLQQGRLMFWLVLGLILANCRNE